MPRLLIDFADAQAVQGWTAVDDRVMGGVSRSRLRYDPAGHAVFEGDVSLDRHGGFASVRSPPGPLGHPGATACLLEVRGAGKQFRLSLFDHDAFDGPSRPLHFACSGGGWQTLHLPLAACRSSFRGRELAGAPALDPARIRQLGLMIAERQAGPFALDIRSIRLV